MFDTLCVVFAPRTPPSTRSFHRKKVYIVCQKGINELQTLYVGFKAVEIIKLYYMVPCRLNKMGFNFFDLCSDLEPD